MVPLSPVRPVPILLALGAVLTLAACVSVDSPRRSSTAPTVRCVDEPGRGGSLEATRPLFFFFCTQSP